MNRTLVLMTAAALLVVSTCASTGADVEPVAVSAAATPASAGAWSFDSAAPALRAASCVSGDTAPESFSALDLKVTPLTTKQTQVVARRLPEGAALAGAWELGASDLNFGGLSGLAIESGTSLLAVTDAGGWVRLTLADGVPSAASIGYMRGADGLFLSGKGENDAEGLVVRDGLAFVSFERDFRIEAFDLAGCGAAARAVKIAGLPETFDGETIEDNQGPEALQLTPDGTLRFGFEGASDSVSPIGAVRASGAAGWTGAVAANPPGFALVAADAVTLASGETREIYLYRAFDPIRGARSVLTWGRNADQRLSLARPALTDNFEGLAAQLLESGAVRVWIVSDSNFSGLQRTLLYAFDLPI
jgi:hypothetical protein